MSEYYEQSRSEGRTYKSPGINYAKEFNTSKIYNDIKTKQEEESKKARLEEIGNGKYVKISSDYRLLFHASPSSEEEKILRNKLLEIIANESNLYSLKSLNYGLLGEFGNRKLNAYISSKNLSDEEIRLIGYNDYTYFGIASPSILSKNTSYMEGYQKAIEDHLLSIINSNQVYRNEVVISLQDKLDSLNKNHYKR